MLGTNMSDWGVKVYKSGELKIPTMRLSKLACDSAVGELTGSTVVRSCACCEGGEHTTPVGRNGAIQPTISTLSIHWLPDSCNVRYRMNKVNHSLCCTTTIIVLPEWDTAENPASPRQSPHLGPHGLNRVFVSTERELV